MKLLQNIVFIKQWTTKWPYISNAVFRIAGLQHHEKVTFIGFREGDRPNRPLHPDPPLPGSGVTFQFRH